MADTVRQVDHYDFEIENNVGAGAHLLGRLRASNVNLLAIWGYAMGDRGIIGIVPRDGAGFAAAAKAANLDLPDPTKAFYISGGDRMGAIAEHLDKLAAAGVNVEAAHAIADAQGAFGALIYVDEDDVAEAAAALGAT